LIVHPTLERVSELMREFHRPWAIAGGWSIDLFLGRQTREHADVDVAILRRDQVALQALLDGGRVEKVVEHQLRPWMAAEWLALPIHEVHATLGDGFHVEFLLNEFDPETDEWVFRRDDRVRLPFADAIRGDAAVPYLAPEVVLLFKSKYEDAKEDGDFRAALPRLEPHQRLWLRNALAMTAPNHRWTQILS
jgi:hypothetical protein